MILCDGNTGALQAKFARVLLDDWSEWEHNEAEECLLMLGLAIPSDVPVTAVQISPITI